jgi:hypothetical protein
VVLSTDDWPGLKHAFSTIMFPKSKSERSHVLKGGAVAGLVGGLVIALIGILGNLAEGRGFWVGLKGASAPFLGASRAYTPGFDANAILLGVIGHFLIALIWGVLFGVFVYGASRLTTVLAGLAWGLVVWVGMFLLVLPMVGLRQMAHGVPVGAAIVQHLIFGVATALGFLPYQRTEASGLATSAR